MTASPRTSAARSSTSPRTASTNPGAVPTVAARAIQAKQGKAQPDYQIANPNVAPPKGK